MLLARGRSLDSSVRLLAVHVVGWAEFAQTAKRTIVNSEI